MFYAIPPVTRWLLGVNLAMFAAQWLLGDFVTLKLALWPVHSVALGGAAGFQPWQILTYSFLHGGVGHLAFNMFALYMFGSELERLWGPKRFLNLYLASVISAALAQLALASLASGNTYPTIGASGGVFGLLLAFALYFPHRTLVLLFPPIPMPAWLFVTLYGLLELYLGVTGTQAGVAHFAHLGGMVGAWLLIQYWRGGPPFRLR
jgi:membrane associated rhomboid family serine protease